MKKKNNPDNLMIYEKIGMLEERVNWIVKHQKWMWGAIVFIGAITLGIKYLPLLL